MSDEQHNNINFPCCSILMIQVFVIDSFPVHPPPILSSLFYSSLKHFLHVVCSLCTYNLCPSYSLSCQYQLILCTSPQNDIENISILYHRSMHSRISHFTRKTIDVIASKMCDTIDVRHRRKVNNIIHLAKRTLHLLAINVRSIHLTIQ